jgi:putative NADH-flavin reductase
MKLAIFGATGRTGLRLVEQALDAGHEVVAFSRTPGKLALEQERLSVVHGDLQDPDQVSRAITGADAVLSVLGPTNSRPTYEVSQGIDKILAAMHENNVRRLIQSVGAGVGDPRDDPGLFDRAIKLLLKLVSRYVYEDMLRVAIQIRASDLDWTLVRVPMLTDDPPAGDLRIGYLGQGVGSRVSRADLAAFMLQEVAANRYLRQAPVIST